MPGRLSIKVYFAAAILEINGGNKKRNHMWLILLLLITACFILIKWRNTYYFNMVRKIVDSKKTGMSDLYTAIDGINNVIKGTFSIKDFIDVKLDGNDYKLMTGLFTSIGPNGEYGPMGAVFSSNYICSLDRASLENAKRMNDLLRLSVQNGNTAIFIVKNTRKLKNKIEKEFQPNT